MKQSFKVYWKANKKRYKRMAKADWKGKQPTVFSEGDRVTDTRYGMGIVMKIMPYEVYPVRVEFDSGRDDCYTLDGRYWTNSTEVVLSIVT